MADRVLANKLPPPGHPEAVKKGCKCDPAANMNGAGVDGRAGWYRIAGTCPLHGIDAPREAW